MASSVGAVPKCGLSRRARAKGGGEGGGEVEAGKSWVLPRRAAMKAVARSWCLANRGIATPLESVNADYVVVLFFSDFDFGLVFVARGFSILARGKEMAHFAWVALRARFSFCCLLLRLQFEPVIQRAKVGVSAGYGAGGDDGAGSSVLVWALNFAELRGGQR